MGPKEFPDRNNIPLSSGSKDKDNEVSHTQPQGITKRGGEALVYLLIDCSGSMSGGKLKQAKNGAIDFAKQALEKGYAAGLIKFDTNAKHLSYPKLNVKELRPNIKAMIASGTTNMTDAIKEATKKLIFNDGLNTIVVVTDGQPNNPDSALEAAQKAKDLGIEILCIGTDDANRAFLAKLATRKDLSVKVHKEQLQQGISSMADMLSLPESIEKNNP